MPMYGNTISNITHRILPNPEISWRRNRSLATVIRSQNQRMNRKIANRSVVKLANVKPPLKSIVSLPPFVGVDVTVSATEKPSHVLVQGSDIAEAGAYARCEAASP